MAHLVISHTFPNLDLPSFSWDSHRGMLVVLEYHASRIATDLSGPFVVNWK